MPSIICCSLQFTYLSLVFILINLITTHAQNIPPTKFDGFVYGNRKKFNPQNVLIEAFFDPLCPDSRDSWPPLKQALSNYAGSKVSLVVHPFPLPYHDYAFVASRALHIVNDLNNSATYPLWESFFHHQDKFYNDKTSSKTKNETLDEIIDFVAKSIGQDHLSHIKSGFDDTDTNLKTRVSFKYASSRGVYGTPTFFVNGFQLPDVGSSTDYNGWRKIVDPLLRSKRKNKIGN